MTDLSQHSIEKLEAELTGIHAQIREIKAHKRHVVAALDRKRAAVRAQQLVDSLSDAERQAVAQVISGAGGIGAGGSVGTPGAR